MRTFFVWALAWWNLGCAGTLAVRRSNPPNLPKPTGYSHVVTASPGTTIYLSGQVPLDHDGVTVGPDFRAQARKVFENLGLALAAAGATYADVVKVTVFLRDIATLQEFRSVRDEYFSAASPPASSLVQVTALFRPDVMIEIEAIAVIPAR